MKKDVKSAIADILKLEGAEYVFGYTGGHIMHMWEAVNNAGIKLIFNKQEGNAVYMADGYARVSKKPAVIFGTSGPGVQNMISGLASAFLDSIPLVVIGAAVPSYANGRNALQDSSGRGRASEQRLIFKSCCKQAILAATPETTPNIVREAFRIAMTGRPGPVYLDIPSDFWGVKIPYQRISPERYKNTHLPKCDGKDCLKIIKAFYNAKRPLIIFGEGAEEKEIKEKINKFLGRVQVPYAVSPLAKNYVDEYDKFCLGALRIHGTTKSKVYEYMEEADFILFLGNRMSQWEFDWEYDRGLFGKAKLVQIDPDYSEIGRVYPVDFSAVGSVSSFLESTNFKKHSESKQLLDKVIKLKEKYPRKKRYIEENGIHPINLNNVVEDFVNDRAIIVCDTGYTGSIGILKFRTKLNQQFLHSEKNSPMGYSVPAALGAALAVNNKEQVVCFVGDGSFQMSMNELGTAMNYKLKVIYIIENNGGCISISDFHQRVYGHHCATTFKNPDYVKVAQSYNMKGYRVENTEDFERVFKLAQKDKSSVIIDAKIDQNKMVWK